MNSATSHPRERDEAQRTRKQVKISHRAITFDDKSVMYE